MSVDELVSLYDSTFTGLLDKHCPLVTVRHKVQPMTPWFDAECRATRRRVRAAERRYKRTFLEVNKRAWSTKRAGLRALCERKKTVLTGATKSLLVLATARSCGMFFTQS